MNLLATLRRRTVLVAVVPTVLLVWPGTGSAHALLDKAEPARRAVLSKPPAAIRLWFNEQLEPAFSSLIVVDGTGRPVTRTPAQVSRADPKLLALELPLLAPGEYTVRYQVLSVDGHTVKSSYTFKIKAAAGPR